MKELKFVQLEKGNEEHFELAKSVWLPFIREVNERDNEQEDDEKIIDGLKKRIGIQGKRKDMHFQIATVDDEVIGIAMFAIDTGTVCGLLEPGCGTVMGFYIKPEYRRKGYGRTFYCHIENTLVSDGATKFYIYPDSVTGVPFWNAMGFSDSGKSDPDDKKPIYIKKIKKDIITIQVSKYLTNELAEKVALAQWHSNAPEWVNRIRETAYTDNYFYDSFGVVACNQNDDVVGRLCCIQNEHDKELWYYGDLFVVKEYRRRGIARRMIKTAVNHLSELSTKTLRCYVEPENTASIALQKSLGFSEKPHEAFNNLINDGQLMFEYKLPCLYSIIPATVNEARFVTIFYRQNEDILYGGDISNDDFKVMLSSEDKDEQNFLVCRGCMPVAWLKINGLCGKDIAWISMLVVSDKHQRQGVGTYAVGYAERFVKERGFTKIGIHTTDDNIPAQSLYKKCGYVITGQDECTTGDGVARTEYTLIKTI